jgi:hypothetical protein
MGGIVFPEDFEKKIRQQDLDRRVQESKNRVVVDRRNKEAVFRELLDIFGVKLEPFEKKIYRALLSLPRGKGITMDSLFYTLQYEFTIGELKEALQRIRDRGHARYEDPYGWMLVEEIHDKRRDLEE